MNEDLGSDVPAAERRTLFTIQYPFAAASSGQFVTVAAWQTKSSWYLVADDDRMVSPELQRALAHKLGATTQSLASGQFAHAVAAGAGSCLFSRSGAATRVGAAVVRGANCWFQQK